MTNTEKGEENLDNSCKTIVNKLNELYQKKSENSTIANSIDLDDDEDNTDDLHPENEPTNKKRRYKEMSPNAYRMSPVPLNRSSMKITKEFINFPDVMGQNVPLSQALFESYPPKTVINPSLTNLISPSQSPIQPPQQPQLCHQQSQLALQQTLSNAPTEPQPSQPFVPRVVIIPQGAILHEDKHSGTKVLVLQTLEQYTNIINQLSDTS